MLNHLHVKDLALIDQSEVEFGEGLNILTGETGAGKSILIGSINLALGAKASRDLIRHGREYGFVELIFSELSEKQENKLRELDIEPEDGQLIIRRKISEKRSEIKINDQTVTLAKLRAVTELLIDIHGQHEHQSLLKEGAHLHILDAFGSDETTALREHVADLYQRYTAARKKLSSFQLDEAARQRELDFLEFEIREIEAAELVQGEEEKLAERCRFFQNAQHVESAVSEAQALLAETDFSSAVAAITRALRYDPALQSISDSLYDLQSIAEDTLRDVERYLDQNEYNEEAFRKAEERLDQIRNVMMKYGGTVEKTEQALSEKKKRLQELSDYDNEKKRCEAAAEQARKLLLESCAVLTEKRKLEAEQLAARIRTEMTEMGFLDIRFEMSFSPLSAPTANGMDEAHFVVSLNPGEPLRPLSEVASGGELSRIMLSIKTVLADRDEIPTLIFDEIDTGISGRTAEKVSDKLKKIAASHQVILITHLPQIAAKADRHFEIRKSVSEGQTHTEIRELDFDHSVEELGRLLAGDHLTEAVLANARELKLLAQKRVSE